MYYFTLNMLQSFILEDTFHIYNKKLLFFLVQSLCAYSSIVYSWVFRNNLVFFTLFSHVGDTKQLFEKLPGIPASVSRKDSTLDGLIGSFKKNLEQLFFNTKMDGCFQKRTVSLRKMLWHDKSIKTFLTVFLVSVFICDVIRFLWNKCTIHLPVIYLQNRVSQEVLDHGLFIRFV